MTNKIIYKWGPLSFSTTHIKGKVVHVGSQDEDVFVWTEQELDTNIKYSERTVRIYPTGAKYNGEYLGTVVMPSKLVWHIIEEEV